MISQFYPDQPFTAQPILVPTVTPDRTYLEKIFLLTEEFTKTPDQIRHDRLSRHLYDVYCIMDTEFGSSALSNRSLLETIRAHRRIFNRLKHLPQEQLELRDMVIIPPDTVLEVWRADYESMRQSMLGREAPTFPALIDRLQQLAVRLAAI